MPSWSATRAATERARLAARRRAHYRGFFPAASYRVAGFDQPGLAFPSGRIANSARPGSYWSRSDRRFVNLAAAFQLWGRFAEAILTSKEGGMN